MIDRRKTPRRAWWAAAALLVPAAALPLLFRPAPAAPALLAVLSGASAVAGERSASIVRLSLEDRGPPAAAILSGFDEIGVPATSPDGRRVALAGRTVRGEPTAVWEIAASGSAPRRITGGGACWDPAFLPDQRLVYARILPGPRSAVSSLHTSEGDGSEERRITFGEAWDRGPSVLPDGRIAFRRHGEGGRGPGRLFAVNPDGTGCQMLLEPAEGWSIEAGPWIAGERLFYAESARAGAPGATGDPVPWGERLAGVSTRDPLGERTVIAGPGSPGGAKEKFTSLSELPEGLLVTVGCGQESGAAWRLVPSPGRPGLPAPAGPAALGGLPRSPILALAVAAPRPPRLNLTSVVDERKSTGTIFCLDVRASRLAEVSGSPPGDNRRVRVLGDDGLVLAEGPVEPDGSFLLEVPADRPLNLELWGPDGLRARDTSGFWVRPNENRACIGCHEDPDLAPENRVPLTLERTAPAGAGALTRGESPGKPREKH